MMKIENIEHTAQYCAEQARDLVSGEKMPWRAGQDILASRLARAIEHGVMVHAETMTRSEFEAFVGASCPPGLHPVYCLGVGILPEGFPAFAIYGRLAESDLSPEEYKPIRKAALDMFDYGDDVPRFKIKQGTRH